MWSLFKGNGSDWEPGSYWEFLLGCGSFSRKQLPLLDTKSIATGQVSCFMAHFGKKNKKDSYTLVYLQQWGELSLEVQNARIQILCIYGLMWQMNSFLQVKSHLQF